MLRVIKEVEPPRPSTKLSKSGTLPSVADVRRIDPQRLESLIRGSNMHRVWDSGIIERVENTEEFWLADLAQLDSSPALPTRTAPTWSTSSTMRLKPTQN
jgi:hypothetical protein